MNIYLENFIKNKFKKPGKALDLGAGKFFDVKCLRKAGWECEEVDKNIGVDLEKQYISDKKPFDLVYSNYVLHFLKNKQQLVDTAYKNLKNNGWLFLHTFDQSDKVCKSDLTEKAVRNMLKDFKNVSIKVFSFYDDNIGHKHWHRIIEATAQK
ncbi:class I SAM-dependent methyltransferase [bacterium]|nr:class I SAM-dependent methyltransferase [bacterium]